MSGDQPSNSAGHSELCRERIEDLISKDEKLKERLAAADDRRDHCFAQEVERGADRTNVGPEAKEESKPTAPAEEKQEYAGDAD